MKRKTPGSRRRQPATARGVGVKDRVIETARRLLKENWLDHVSVARLAREAGIVRASLLLQFRDGWSDVAWQLLYEEFEDDYCEWLTKSLAASARKPLEERLFRVLGHTLDRAEETGLLYPNVRSQMFVWGNENASMMPVIWTDVFLILIPVIERNLPDVDEERAHAALETLYCLTLDFAGSSGLFDWNLDERRELLRRSIQVVIAGLRER